MSSSRIVVTPIGGTAPDSWSALLAGESGARSLEHDWVAKYELPVTFAASARVPAETVLARPEAKRLDPSSQYALVAAREAWADAGTPEVEPERLGVDFATGIGGLWTLLDGWCGQCRPCGAVRLQHLAEVENFHAPLPLIGYLQGQFSCVWCQA